jgi:cobalt-zinc-cadmium efflux system membrane fusion protein
MTTRGAKLFRVLGVVVLVMVLSGILTAAMPLVGLPTLLNWRRNRSGEGPSVIEPSRSVELAPGKSDTLRLPADVVQAFRLETVEARPATRPRPLELSGRLNLDPNHLARIHARFGGQVMEIAEVPDTQRPDGQTHFRPLRLGDKVRAGQLLVVVWSKDLGEKKNDLVDALSMLRYDQERLSNLERLVQTGSTSEDTVRQARRNVEMDLNAVNKAESALRTWRLTEAEIEAIKTEAEHIRQRKGKRDPEQVKNWARVEVRAPLTGTILEKNVTIGDIVDTATDLFKIADLRELVVWADAYEEDLPALLSLPPDRRVWTIRLKGDPNAQPLEGQIDYVGEIIDPNQHTALVGGRVNNRDGRLRAGQFITATVELPPSPDEVVIPVTALVEDGHTSIVFVQEDTGRTEYSLRRVAVRQRLPATVTVRSRLTPQQEQLGLQPLRPGEWVVRKGAVELKKALEELQASAKAGK